MNNYERSPKCPEPSFDDTKEPDDKTDDMNRKGLFLCFEIPGALGVNSSLKRAINTHHDKALASRSKGSNTIES